LAFSRSLLGNEPSTTNHVPLDGREIGRGDDGAPSLAETIGTLFTFLSRFESFAGDGDGAFEFATAGSTLFGLSKATSPPPAISASSAMTMYIGIGDLLVLTASTPGAGNGGEGRLLKFELTFSVPRDLFAAAWAPQTEQRLDSDSSGFPH